MLLYQSYYLVRAAFQRSCHVCYVLKIIPEYRQPAGKAFHLSLKKVASCHRTGGYGPKR